MKQPVDPNHAHGRVSKPADPLTQPPPPRAFAQGTGVVLQTVGVILFLSSCCICSVAGAWEPLLSRPEVLERLVSDPPIGVEVGDLIHHPAKAGVMLMVVFSTAGGLAWVGFGLGLQAEKPRSAWAAFGTSVLMLVVLSLAGVGIWIDQAAWTTRLWHGLLMVITLLLTGFTWVALKQFKADPPPRHPPPLPDELL